MNQLTIAIEKLKPAEVSLLVEAIENNFRVVTQDGIITSKNWGNSFEIYKELCAPVRSVAKANPADRDYSVRNNSYGEIIKYFLQERLLYFTKTNNILRHNFLHSKGYYSSLK